VAGPKAAGTEPEPATDVAGRIEGFLLSKGGWIGALGMFLMFGCEAVAKALGGDYIGLVHNLGLLSLAAAATAVLYRGRRNSTMTAQGVAEIKNAQPGKTIPSLDPAIRSAEETLPNPRKG